MSANRRHTLSPTAPVAPQRAGSSSRTRFSLLAVFAVIAFVGVAKTGIDQFGANQAAASTMETQGLFDVLTRILKPKTPTTSYPTPTTPSYPSTPSYPPVNKCLTVKCGPCQHCDSYTGSCVADAGQDNQVCGSSYKADQCEAESRCYAGVCKAQSAADGAACGSYDSTDKCAAPSACYAGKCVAKYAADGTSCGYDDECNSFSCYAGKCNKQVKVDAFCGAAPNDFCALQGKCSSEGKCVGVNRPKGTPCRGSSPDSCTEFKCNGNGKCSPENRADGAVCGVQYEDTECGFPDTCYNGQCVSSYPTDGKACGQSDECNSRYCSKGTCVNKVQVNAPCGDKPHDECSLPGYCNAQGKCYQGIIADGTSCGYKEDCFTSTCQDGRCSRYQQPEGYVCGPGSDYDYDSDCAVPDRCDNNGKCTAAYGDSDGQKCGYPEECQRNECYQGKCKSYPVDDYDNVPCGDDYNQCTNDVCRGGYCAHEAVAEYSPCKDESYYNGCVDQYCSYGNCVTKESGKCKGCGIGFWKKSSNECNWVGYTRKQKFSDVFGVKVKGNAGLTLGDALSLSGGGQNALARHGTAALLNSAYKSKQDNFRFYYSTKDVISLVYSNWDKYTDYIKDTLAEYNDKDCNINTCGKSSSYGDDRRKDDDDDDDHDDDDERRKED